MTLQEMDAEIQGLMEQRAELRRAQRLLRKIRDRKAARVSAKKKVEGFTDAEREALAEMVSPPSIPSEEAFGVPGLPAWLRRLLGR